MSAAVVGLKAGAWGTVTGDPQPTLSWRIETASPGIAQDAYHVQVGSDELFNALLADTGEVGSPECLFIPWPATPLESRQRACWRVRARTGEGWTDWSRPAWIEAALLGRADWTARFITSTVDDSAEVEAGPAPIFRTAFDLAGEVASARMYVTALGSFEVEINDARVGTDVIAPDWTAYKYRVPYHTYDVTDLVRSGENTINAVLGNGWYRGRLGFDNPVPRCIYGKRLALLAQLEVTTTTGGRIVVATDSSWKTSLGPIRRDDHYNGCDIDLTKAPKSWSPAIELSSDRAPALFATDSPPVRVTEVRPAVARWPARVGATIVDLGQNGVGWLRFRVRGGQAGDEVVVRHAEVLDDDGQLFTKPLRAAKATDTYVLDGSSPVTLEPKFTFHGFRYAEISAPAHVEIDDVVHVIVHSDLERTGTFECSDLYVNRLFENIRWSQRGNFVSIPTDCPQRSERMGWTGDAQVFADTGAFIYDCRAFLGRWLDDLALDQRPDGAVANVVPNPFDPNFPGCGGWGDAATVVPWSLYTAYGDLPRLGRSYNSMKAWVDYTAGRVDATGVRVPFGEATSLGSANVFTAGIEFGDWCDPSAGGSALEASTDRYYIASVYLAHSARLVAKAATLLGESGDVDVYSALAERTRRATWERWGDETVRSQTGCAMALEFDIAPPQERETIARALAELVEAEHYKIGTGFLGTPLVLRALTSNGYTGHALAMLLQKECPSWLHQVVAGSTTVWERWDAIDADGRIRRGSNVPDDVSAMLSFNHYAFGAVGAWLVRDLVGLAPDEHSPGYRHVKIEPHPGGGLSWARATLDSPYGPIRVEWHYGPEGLRLDVSLPPGTTGTITLPEGLRDAGVPIKVGPGTQHVVSAPI